MLEHYDHGATDTRKTVKQKQVQHFYFHITAKREKKRLKVFQEKYFFSKLF